MSESRPQGHCRNWLASTVGLLTLLIAGACLWCALPGSGRAEAVTAPSEVRHYETKRISRIVPFDWALAGNPTGERDLQFGEVIHPKQWRLLKFVAPKKGGGEAEVDMARPLTWLYSQWQASLAQPNEAVAEDQDDEDSIVAVDDARLAAFDPRQLVGRTIYISVPECGIDGHAKVLAVEDCPNLKPRPGPEYQLVTATFRHRGAKILDLRIEGAAETIGTTPNHPFWSEDKQQFVRADELKPGERLRGLNDTFPRVLSNTSRPSTHDVYNLEVHLDHVYHVANNGVLVHNGADDCLVDVFRGVGANHPGLADALAGKAVPRGGAMSAALHNRGFTNSPFTSWTTDRSVAEAFARKHGAGGVVLQDRVPRSSLTVPAHTKFFGRKGR